MTGELEYGSMAKDRSLEYDRSAHAPVNSRLRTEANPSHCMGGWWPWETKELSQSNVVLAMVQLLPVSRYRQRTHEKPSQKDYNLFSTA